MMAVKVNCYPWMGHFRFQSEVRLEDYLKVKFIQASQVASTVGFCIRIQHEAARTRSTCT